MNLFAGKDGNANVEGLVDAVGEERVGRMEEVAPAYTHEHIHHEHIHMSIYTMSIYT